MQDAGCRIQDADPTDYYESSVQCRLNVNKLINYSLTIDGDNDNGDDDDGCRL